VGCGHRSSALSLRPLLRGTCPCIVACEHICRHYLSPNSHSMRFGPRHFSRLILASSFRCFLLWIALPWLVRLSIGPVIGLLWDRLWARPCSSGFPPALYLGSSDRGAVPAQQRNGHCRLDLAPHQDSSIQCACMPSNRRSRCCGAMGPAPRQTGPL
jgi:hypothetical protein